jgi:hypothetical protein
VKVAVGDAVFENWPAFVFGPLATDHAPAPTVGVFPPSAIEPVSQIVRSGPALAGVGCAVKVSVASSVEAGHGGLVIVHRTVYVPAPPAGTNVEVGEVASPNCEASVDGPPTTDHAPTPTVGVFAPSVAGEVTHRVWSAPAFAVEGLCVAVITTSSVESRHGAFEIVQRSV